jgi:hypothetical protein
MIPVSKETLKEMRKFGLLSEKNVGYGVCEKNYQTTKRKAFVELDAWNMYLKAKRSRKA